MTTPSLFRIWMSAARLRTLPLSIAGILTGNALAATSSSFSWWVFGGTILTAISFQILSNFANDYGDGIKGTDNENRIGPKRVMQQQWLSEQVLFRGIVVMGVLGLLCSVTTIWLAFGLSCFYSLLFLGLAVAAILAAYKYTAGKGAYGYHALGDLFVMLFFGLLAVCGSYFLQLKSLPHHVWYFALAIGGLSTAVLNLNNMRDITNDITAGKITVASLLGIHRAKTYHTFLLLGSMVSFVIGIGEVATSWVSYLPMLLLLPLLEQLRKALIVREPTHFDALLKPLALLSFGLGILLFVVQLIPS